MRLEERDQSDGAGGLKRLLRAMVARGASLDPQRLRRVLFVKLFAIGDCLNATPALRALRHALPRAGIDVLVGKWSAAVFRNSPHADRVIEIEDRRLRRPDLNTLLQLVRRLRRERYDAALIFHRDPKLAAFMGAAGIPIRVGLDLEGDGFLFTHPVPEPAVEHEIVVYNRVLSPLGIEVRDRAMEIFPTVAQVEAAAGLWDEAGFLDRDIVVGLAPGGASNPGETMPQRIWPHYATLAPMLAARGLRLAYFGGEVDLPMLQQLPSGSEIGSFIGRCDLATSAALMKRCQLIVAHDSGPMHLAAAAGARTLTLFAPTDPRRKAPLGTGHRHLTADLPCAPCYHRGKWPADCSQECIGKIGPEQVLEQALEMLSGL